jgi:hypothetical protein
MDVRPVNRISISSLKNSSNRSERIRTKGARDSQRRASKRLHERSLDFSAKRSRLIAGSLKPRRSDSARSTCSDSFHRLSRPSRDSSAQNRSSKWAVCMSAYNCAKRESTAESWLGFPLTKWRNPCCADSRHLSSSSSTTSDGHSRCRA